MLIRVNSEVKGRARERRKACLERSDGINTMLAEDWVVSLDEHRDDDVMVALLGPIVCVSVCFARAP